MPTANTIRIVFMGTPEFAVPSLAFLHAKGIVSAVITAPDKPAGRGRQLKSSPVKEFALGNGLRCLQPTNLKDPGFQEELKAIGADLFVVLAFRMLPEKVWNMPQMGTINLHASLLPEYRGAAPINWAVINGESRTGLSTFRLKHEIDTGDVILQKEMHVSANETAGELHDRMMVEGGALLWKSIELLCEPDFKPSPQKEGTTRKEAPKLTNDNTRIDWTNPAEMTHNLVRGLSPYPGSWTSLNDKKFKIYETMLTKEASHISPGLFRIESNRLFVACGDEWLEIRSLQAPGKKRMPIADFLRGNSLPGDGFN